MLFYYILFFKPPEWLLELAFEIFIDHEAGEIICLVVSVRLSVCLSGFVKATKHYQSMCLFVISCVTSMYMFCGR